MSTTSKMSTTCKSCKTCLDHFDSQVFSCSLVDVVGDGDGRSDLAEVGDDAAVEALDAFSSNRIPVQQQ